MAEEQGGGLDSILKCEPDLPGIQVHDEFENQEENDMEMPGTHGDLATPDDPLDNSNIRNDEVDVEEVDPFEECEAQIEPNQRATGVYCCVEGCHSNNIRDSGIISFHKFPKDDPNQADLWINAVRKKGKDGNPWKPTSNAVICSKHFVDGKMSSDKNNSAYVPTIFPNDPDLSMIDRINNVKACSIVLSDCEASSFQKNQPSTSKPTARMATFCCVENCQSNTVKDHAHLKFYGFPKIDDQRREAWIRAINRKNEDGTPWKPNNLSVVCSIHFVGGEMSKDRKNLGYIPTLFPDDPAFPGLKRKNQKMSIGEGSSESEDLEEERRDKLSIRGAHYCCVDGCGVNNKRDSGYIKLYRFTVRDHVQRDLWLKAIKKKRDKHGNPWVPTRNSNVCELHFINRKMSRDPNQPGYVPTIFPNDPGFPKLEIDRRNRVPVAKKFAHPKPPGVGEDSTSDSDDDSAQGPDFNMKGAKYCCVPGCHSSSKRDRGLVTFHSFPTGDREQRELWLKAVNRKEKDGKPWQPTRQACICSLHFVNNKMMKERSHPGYVPTLFPNDPGFPKIEKWSKVPAAQKYPHPKPPGVDRESSDSDDGPVKKSKTSGRYCCVKNCKSNTHLDSGFMKFYSFPKRNPEQMEAWREAIARVNGRGWTLSGYSLVCSLHFVAGEVKRERNHPAYCPTLFPGDPNFPKIDRETRIPKAVKSTEPRPPGVDLTDSSASDTDLSENQDPDTTESSKPRRKKGSYCSFQGCHSCQSWDVGIKFHRFPAKDREQYEAWIAAVNRAGSFNAPWRPSKHSVVCSLHFVDGIMKKKRDSPSYIPAIFPSDPAFPQTGHAAGIKRSPLARLPPRPVAVVQKPAPPPKPGIYNSVKICCVHLCPSNSGTDPAIDFHKVLGRDERQRKAWVDAINTVNGGNGWYWKPDESSHVCALHFHNRQMSGDPNDPTYKPTIFSPDLPGPQKPSGQRNLRVNEEESDDEG